VLPRIDGPLEAIMATRRALVRAGELVAVDAVQVAASAHKRSREETDENERNGLLAAHLRKMLAYLEN